MIEENKVASTLPAEILLRRIRKRALIECLKKFCSTAEVEQLNVLSYSDLLGVMRARCSFEISRIVKENSNEKDLDQYIKENKLDKLINFDENKDHVEEPYDSVNGNLKIPFPPDKADLVRLHKLIRERKVFTVLEFGIGYSTIIIADALQKNLIEFSQKEENQKLNIRNRHMFQVFSVDASSKWITEFSKSLLKDRNTLLRTRMHIHFSEVKIGTFRDQICHYYTKLSNIIPDFIYLDGPMANDVQGEINGLSFKCLERTVMSGDLLLMEPTFLPGTFILIDGRTNNARFLERNFSRKYKVTWNKEEDYTTFELDEERLGKYNILGKDVY